MNTRPVSIITKLWLISILVLALLVWDGVAGAEAGLDEALIGAARRGDIERVKSYLEKGADIKGRDEEGTTALMTAAFEGHLEMVNFLLDRGADVNAKNKEGQTALIAASRGGHQEVTKTLLDKGADINAGTGDFGTALMAAAYAGHLSVVNLLLNRGAHVNAKNKEGGTALWNASRKGMQTLWICFWTGALTLVRKLRTASRRCGGQQSKVTWGRGAASG